MVEKEPVGLVSFVHYLKFIRLHEGDKFALPVAVCEIENGWITGSDIKSKVTCPDCQKIINAQAPK